jgi:hypothetical protein
LQVVYVALAMTAQAANTTARVDERHLQRAVGGEPKAVPPLAEAPTVDLSLIVPAYKETLRRKLYCPERFVCVIVYVIACDSV